LFFVLTPDFSLVSVLPLEDRIAAIIHVTVFSRRRLTPKKERVHAINRETKQWMVTGHRFTRF
jgi:hypothetical protein